MCDVWYVMCGVWRVSIDMVCVACWCACGCSIWVQCVGWVGVVCVDVDVMWMWWSDVMLRLGCGGVV